MTFTYDVNHFDGALLDFGDYKDQIQRLWKMSFTEAYFPQTWSSLTSQKAKLFVLVSNETVIGTLAVTHCINTISQANFFQFANFCVHPEFRRSYLGTELMEDALFWILESFCEELSYFQIPSNRAVENIVYDILSHSNIEEIQYVSAVDLEDSGYSLSFPGRNLYSFDGINLCNHVDSDTIEECVFLASW
ncbi:MAG: GNAT family N-acetyltransferase [Patescibacteria group bacterium]